MGSDFGVWIKISEGIWMNLGQNQLKVIELRARFVLNPSRNAVNLGDAVAPQAAVSLIDLEVARLEAEKKRQIAWAFSELQMASVATAPVADGGREAKQVEVDIEEVIHPPPGRRASFARPRGLAAFMKRATVRWTRLGSRWRARGRGRSCMEIAGHHLKSIEIGRFASFFVASYWYQHAPARKPHAQDPQVIPPHTHHQPNI